MANFKCKFCGSDMTLPEGQSTTLCAACGSLQTVPTVCDQPLPARFARANRLRLACEFDKAAGIYESITADFPEEPEGYWGLVLCKYGVVYRDDPATGKKAPVCNRASFDCVLDDENYEQALENADPAARRVYRAEAKQIETLRGELLAIAEKEPPYDIFLCCVETDEAGNRTEDFQLALAMTRRLMEMGYKVFFPRIGLTSIHPAAEPHMFAALHSAAVMLVFGTDYEHFDAVWVKNQWSRFLRLTAGDKHLIPCFKGIDAFDMPREFAKLPGLDMGTPGAAEQLLERIEQLLKREKAPAAEAPVMEEPAAEEPAAEAPVMEEPAAEVPVVEEPVVEEPVMEEPAAEAPVMEEPAAVVPVEEAPAIPEEDPREPIYIRANAMMKAAREAAYREAAKLFDSIEDFKDAAALAESCRAAVEEIRQKEEYAQKDVIYQQALTKLQSVKTEKGYRRVAELFDSVSDHRDAATYAQQCRETAETIRKNATYDTAVKMMVGSQLNYYREALKQFETIPDWKDSAERIDLCRKKIEELEARNEQAARSARKKARLWKILLPIICLVLLAAVATVTVVLPTIRYNDAVELMDAGRYEEAIVAFEALKGFKDSENLAVTCRTRVLDRQYDAAVALLNAGKYDEAAAAFQALGDHRDSATMVLKCRYRQAVALSISGDTLQAICGFTALGDYRDAAEQAAALRKSYQQRLQQKTIVAGHYYTVGLKNDGTVVATGNNDYGQCNVSGWKDVIAIDAYTYHTVGLKANGTVVATGRNYSGQCNVYGWQNIVAIAVGLEHTVGLKADGTVVAVGSNSYGQCNVREWTDIVAIAADFGHTIGLKADGTVVATGMNDYGQCEVSHWKDIIGLTAGEWFTVGIKSNGTPAVVGVDMGRSKVINWTNLVSADGGLWHTVALKADGTAVAAWDSIPASQCDVSGWQNIVAISAGAKHTVGLKADGTVITVGSNDYGQCNVSDWSDIKLP